MEQIATFRKVMVMSAFALLGGMSIYFGTKVKFSFDFEQFFPEGDEEASGRGSCFSGLREGETLKSRKS